MKTYTASDFCQGHGGGRECTFSPEADGCLQHGDDFDHGTISYCDGSCSEAREHFAAYLRTHGQESVVLASEITLEAHGANVSYEVTFEGGQAEDWALAYMSSHKGLHFGPVHDRPFSFDAFPRMAEALFPQCHHGLSLDMCMDSYGDAHFGTRDQELAQGW